MSDTDLGNNNTILSEDNIKEIEGKLNERMVYADENAENGFKDNIKDILKDGAYGLPLVNDLKNEKYLKIRKSLQDDQGFIEIENKLPHITEMYNNEKSKMNELIKQKSQLNKPKTYFLNKTKTNDEKNAYDAKITGIDKQITEVNTLVKRLDKIQNNINTLKSVYDKDIKNEEDTITAGKRKTRSNRKKSRKSRKSYKKSNHKK